MQRLLPMMLAAIGAGFVGGASAATAGNPLLGRWELNGEDGWFRHGLKIHRDVVGLYFAPGSVASATGILDAPVFGAPIAFGYAVAGPTVYVDVGGMGSTVAYVFTSHDEMGITITAPASTAALHRMRPASRNTGRTGPQKPPWRHGTGAQAAQVPAPSPKIPDCEDALEQIDEASKRSAQ